MARPSTPIRSESGRPDHLIDEQTDRELSRIVMRHFFSFAALLLLMTFVMAFLNVPHTPFFPYRHLLDFVSILIVMSPFFLGTNRFFAARLRFGREFVEKREWHKAVASLEAFNHIGQRFLDPTGEAHYLLSLALAKEGRTTDAEKVRAYVLKSHPSSKWAEKIRETERAKPRASRLGAEKTDQPGTPADEARKRVAKPKRRRL